MEKKQADEVRSESIVEIMSAQPAFLVRKGSGIFLCILAALLTFAWFIRYPDVVDAPTVLTSINAPKEVISNREGKLVKIFVNEGDTVEAGQVLGYCESVAKPDMVIKLSNHFDNVQRQIDNQNFSNIAVNEPENELGELQAAYQEYKRQLLEFERHYANGINIRKRAMLRKDLEILQQARQEMMAQEELIQQDVELSAEDYSVHKKLADEKVISSGDLRNEKSKLLNKRLTLPQIKLGIINNQASQNQKLKEIAELDEQILQQQGIFTDAFRTFRSQLEDWKKNFLLMAPVRGRVTFAAFLEENQHIKAGQVICFVSPGDARYYAEMLVPQDNLGKVVLGQKALLRFPSYPFQEYGTIEGKVSFVSNIPLDSGYLARVELPRGLETNMHKYINYRAGLMAEGKIITHDVNLLQRLYYRMIRKVTW